MIRQDCNIRKYTGSGERDDIKQSSNRLRAVNLGASVQLHAGSQVNISLLWAGNGRRSTVTERNDWCAPWRRLSPSRRPARLFLSFNI